jgi:GT2 family glycosyltransferase
MNLDQIKSFPFEEISKKFIFEENKHNEYGFLDCIFSPNESQPYNVKALVNNYTVDCCLYNNNFRSNNNSVIVICSKDHSEILKYTLKKLKSFDIDKKYDILLIDDRSEKKDILELSKEFRTSYIRIDNSLNKFNYSLINNIAAAYVKAFKKEKIIFLNNDLWPTNYSSLDHLIEKHTNYNADITGCKLLYPSEKEYLELGNPPHMLKPYFTQIYETIQHGGIYFLPRTSLFLSNARPISNEAVFAPSHLWRFYPKDTVMSSIDNLCNAVTGAIHIVEVDSFINKIGGLNMALSTSFQDIDLCLNAISANGRVLYVGSESMVHAESLTHAIETKKFNERMISDNICWDLFWGEKIIHLLGFKL